MPRRGSSHGRLRRIAPAVAVAASLLAPLALVSPATAEEADPALVEADPAATTSTEPAPAPTPAPTPATVNVSRASASATRTVSIIDFEFDPGPLTIKTGDTVTWTNLGAAEEGHDVVGDGLESPTLHTGESYSHTFNAAGTFSYICSIHPDMKGSVEVLERSSGASKDKKSSHGSGSGSGSSGGGGSGSGSGSGSESAAVNSSDPGGSSGSLPATGEDLPPLAAFGLLFLGAGIALRLAGAGPLRRLG
jgi:plastocyanin